VHTPSTGWFDAAGKLGFLARSDAYVTAGGNATYVQYREP
jgi:hypothetical protein